MMRHNYIPAPYTIYKNIKKLSPGTILKVTTQSKDFQIKQFWSFLDTVTRGKNEPFVGSPSEAVDALENILLESVGMHMKADVPLGGFLSGGIDSSTIIALMQAQSTRPIKIFTIGFDEPGYNEAEHAKRVSQHLGTDHRTIHVTE